MTIAEFRADLLSKFPNNWKDLAWRDWSALSGAGAGVVASAPANLAPPTFIWLMLADSIEQLIAAAQDDEMSSANQTQDDIFRLMTVSAEFEALGATVLSCHEQSSEAGSVVGVPKRLLLALWKACEISLENSVSATMALRLRALPGGKLDPVSKSVLGQITAMATAQSLLASTPDSADRLYLSARHVTEGIAEELGLAD